MPDVLCQIYVKWGITMKKVLSIGVSLVLVLCLALCMTACGGKKTIVGKWQAEFDMTDMLDEFLGSSGEMAEFFDIDKLALDIVFEFKDNDKVEAYVTDESAEKMAEEVIEATKKALEKMLEEEGMSIEDFEGLTGMTMDDMIEEAFGSSDPKEIGKTLTEDMEELGGYYKIDGDKLYIAEDKDDLDDEENAVDFELKGDKLTISFEDQDAPVDELVFKRIK